MTNLKNKLALLATAVAAASAFAVGGPSKIVHASGSCTYSEHSKTINHVYNLSDGNYVDEVLSEWSVPQSGCTQWSQHNWGDTQVEVAYELGSTADRFYLSSGIDPENFGWDVQTYGSAPPMGSGECDLGACPFYWNGTNGPYGWTDPNVGTFEWADSDALGGTNGDTTVYTVTGIVQLLCPNGVLGVG